MFRPILVTQEISAVLSQFTAFLLVVDIPLCLMNGDKIKLDMYSV